MTLVSPVAPRNWHTRTALVSALRADGEPSRFVRSGEHTAFPGRRTTRCRGLSRSPERNLDIHGLNPRHLVIRIQCGQLADAPALRHLPARSACECRAAPVAARPGRRPTGGPLGRSARPARIRREPGPRCANLCEPAGGRSGRSRRRRRAIGSAGERLVHTEEVTGSIPVSPTGQELLGRSRMHVRAKRCTLEPTGAAHASACCLWYPCESKADGVAVEHLRDGRARQVI
ncbi:MAG: hypothetical protein QOJ73_7388 [Streptosporangiaceae bacterium]|nr:hypothetical protein [Streptosporangiaceae bacterium]